MSPTRKQGRGERPDSAKILQVSIYDKFSGGGMYGEYYPRDEANESVTVVGCCEENRRGAGSE